MNQERLSHALKAAKEAADYCDRKLMGLASIELHHLRVLVGAVFNLRAQLAEGEARAKELNSASPRACGIAARVWGDPEMGKMVMNQAVAWKIACIVQHLIDDHEAAPGARKT